MRKSCLFALLTMFIPAVFVTSCSNKRKDFETAKNAVTQELRSPGTARFCRLDDAEFSISNGARTVKLWVENRNVAGVVVRTHFDVTINPKSGMVTGATCLECAAEDEKQKLNEAVAELQGLTAPSKKTPAIPAQREEPQSQLQPSHQDDGSLEPGFTCLILVLPADRRLSLRRPSQARQFVRQLLGINRINNRQVHVGFGTLQKFQFLRCAHN